MRVLCRQVNGATKNNIFEEKKAEYWKASKRRKGELLLAVCEVSGLTRKGTIKRFRKLQMRDPAAQERRGRPRCYTPDVIAALKQEIDRRTQKVFAIQKRHGKPRKM
ncbi:MAG: hypothetical protein A2W52_04715 [Candidatus Taylorbacteria bacterium RIFCSPHIGHO2_02_49_25]|uniref:Uncharacterized protein n=1 Tax=Candidatus Taylorbacteria bacterium RIFCSPHIGHO2_02_49_25 TaxID=1802305 RepID=A0A1G2MJ41_9BACT|nr:MAG: hypothetical protein UY62_C0068G0002 [Parcubacteria group bacterium GW2011_GWF2_50_9]OHA20784.1 MAG: hypothetical protein A2759_04380 [Candidatus Taylorbacteria bacterium RIFCSPHIGHO2_01_FULL_49_60]OHA23179.1 MAG: hypothetical protein A2W52_04715 [Candidatus Taylorbacteria bacterium RIFCSPHIGHO2_02_49_25]OHA35734.1 MAG: hypothetical protein A3B27_02185 [Candidatus Taylorbacteria bacterium RIFCSPLOWO2_01_FULL_50_130]OHA47150.1 MAG: hypothetical protein A3G61_01285 [Candidatus Taylorbacte